MKNSDYTLTIKLTPRGKHYVIVKIGTDIVYVSRTVHRSGEEAMTEARDYLEKEHSNVDQPHHPTD